MNPAEIVHRLHELRARAGLAAHVGGWASFNQARLTDISFLKIKNALACAPVSWRDEDVAFLGRVWPVGTGADGVLEGRQWFLDPVSGHEWPGRESNAFSIDVRSTSATPRPERPFGDVKYVWEPNRLQVLHALACDVAREDDCGPAWRKAMAWIASWMAANPPYRGVNWSSGIEIALRIASVSLLIAAGAHKADGRDRETLAAFLSAHARWLAMLPSLHSSANNHRVAEGLGLYLAGLLLADGAAYEAEGRTILHEQSQLQILPDGVGVEQSPTYQAFTMELVGLGVIFAEATGRPFEENVLGRLEKGVKFLFCLLDRAGRAFGIGDDDEGRVVTNPAMAEPLYVASIVHSIGALSGATADGLAAPGYLRESLFGAFTAAPRRVLTNRAFHCFGTGGYSIARATLAGHTIHLAFDHGPLGFGKLAAHGHADALALWLNIDDRQVFVDAGTYLYHSGEELRNALRSSTAHNTLTISGASQSIASSAFSWSHVAHAWPKDGEDLRGDQACPVMAGEHDGYLRRYGVRHRRSIAFNDDGFSVSDSLIGREGASPVEISFLCAPHLDAVLQEQFIMLSDRGTKSPVCWIAPPEEFSASLVKGDSASGRGLYSPQFGAIEAATQIVLQGKLIHCPDRQDGVIPARQALTRISLISPAGRMGA